MGANSDATSKLTRIYHNGTPNANVLPGAPSGLNSGVSGNSVFLVWDPATDNKTPEGGLIVSDYMGGRIVEFDAKGNVVHQLKNFPWAVTSIALMK